LDSVFINSNGSKVPVVIKGRAGWSDRVAVIFSQFIANYYLFREVWLIEAGLYGGLLNISRKKSPYVP
jgi:hypothetical protein